MKKLILFLTVFTLIISSCEKNSKTNDNESQKELIKIGNVYFEKSQIKSVEYMNNLFKQDNTKSCPPWLQKIGQWIWAHSGTYLFYPNCNLNLPCGPCVGLCSNASSPGGFHNTPILTTEASVQGYCSFGLVPYDETKFVITFGTPERLVKDGVFYVPEDINLGSTIASYYSLSSLVIKRGVYPVVYDFQSSGQTIIDVQTN